MALFLFTPLYGHYGKNQRNHAILQEKFNFSSPNSKKVKIRDEKITYKNHTKRAARHGQLLLLFLNPQ